MNYLKIKFICICLKNKMKIGIIGYGSFTREILPKIKNFDIFLENSYYNNFLEEKLKKIELNYNCKVYKLNNFESQKYKALVTIPDLLKRMESVNLLPSKTIYCNFIDPYSIFIDKSSISLGKSTIICSNTILTTNIKIGDFCQFNLKNTIAHDVNIGNYVTTAPSVDILGNCNIGNRVYIGAKSTIKNKISVCDDVVIGMCSGVIKNITEKGTYIGIPSKPMKNFEKN